MSALLNNCYDAVLRDCDFAMQQIRAHIAFWKHVLAPLCCLPSISRSFPYPHS
jgi:hypothetical protein